MTAQTRSYKYFIPIVRGLGKLFFRISVKGIENIPTDGPILVVSNHVDNIDPAVISAVYPRQIIFLAKKEIVEHAPRWVAALFKAYGTIFIDREKIAKSSLGSALEYLNAGFAIGIFPEGTRSLKGTLISGQPGAAFLAIESNAIVQPVAIIGSNKYKINPLFLFKRHPLTVIFGSPIMIGKRNLKAKDLTEEIMNSIAKLLPESMQGVYYEPD